MSITTVWSSITPKYLERKFSKRELARIIYANLDHIDIFREGVCGPEDGYSAHPSHCPVTGRPFFMTIEDESGKMVATYGGPFDSYTIPEWNADEKEFRSDRYDHDAGYWVDGGEPYSFILVEES